MTPGRRLGTPWSSSSLPHTVTALSWQTYPTTLARLAWRTWRRRSAEPSLSQLPSAPDARPAGHTPLQGSRPGAPSSVLGSRASRPGRGPQPACLRRFRINAEAQLHRGLQLVDHGGMLGPEAGSCSHASQVSTYQRTPYLGLEGRASHLARAQRASRPPSPGDARAGPSSRPDSHGLGQLNPEGGGVGGSPSPRATRGSCRPRDRGPREPQLVSLCRDRASRRSVRQ